MIDEFDILRPTIVRQLGKEAWAYMSAGGPIVHEGYVYFWIASQEYAWGIDTYPPLLTKIETDQEFATFKQLLEDVGDGVIHCPKI